MNRLSKPSSSTVRANCLMPRARSGPSPSHTYDGRKTPNRPTSLIDDTSFRGAFTRPSSTAVDRVALLEERVGALEHVLRLEDPNRRLELRREARLEVQVRGLVDQALRLADRDRPALRDLFRDGRRLDDRLPGRDDAGHEADRERLVRGQDPARQDQLLRERGPNDTRQALGAAGAGRHREPDLGQPELRLLRRDPDVARQGELEATAERVPLDRR